MTFFDDVPAHEEEEEAFDESDLEPDLEPEPPGRWVGGVVALDEVVGRSDTAAVAVRRLTAYPSGFELDVVAWIRGPRPRLRDGHRPIMLKPGPWWSDRDDGTLITAAAAVRLGVQYPDGAKVTNLQHDRWGWSPDQPDPAHGMRSRNGSADSRLASHTFWIWPIPDAGDVEFVCDWPAQAIPESRIRIDGSVLRDAAARSIAVWPVEPT